MSALTCHKMCVRNFCITTETTAPTKTKTVMTIMMMMAAVAMAMMHDNHIRLVECQVNLCNILQY
jgi:hypothetical protein